MLTSGILTRSFVVRWGTIGRVPGGGPRQLAVCQSWRGTWRGAARSCSELLRAARGGQEALPAPLFCGRLGGNRRVSSVSITRITPPCRPVSRIIKGGCLNKDIGKMNGCNAIDFIFDGVLVVLLELIALQSFYTRIAARYVLYPIFRTNGILCITNKNMRWRFEFIISDFLECLCDLNLIFSFETPPLAWLNYISHQVSYQ